MTMRKAVGWCLFLTPCATIVGLIWVSQGGKVFLFSVVLGTVLTAMLYFGVKILTKD